MINVNQPAEEYAWEEAFLLGYTVVSISMVYPILSIQVERQQPRTLIVTIDFALLRSLVLVALLRVVRDANIRSRRLLGRGE